MKQAASRVKAPRRLTRAESATVTRERLLAVAADLFSDVGYQAASVEAVVAVAGFTRGAFYAHFVDKADVFITLLEEGRRADLERVRALLATTEAAALQGGVQEWFDGLAAQNRWELAYAEFWPQAVRNPVLRARLAARQEHVRAAIADMIDTFCRASNITLPMPTEQVASLMLSLADGVSAQRHLDPDALPDNAFTTATGLLWAGLLSGEE